MSATEASGHELADRAGAVQGDAVQDDAVQDEALHDGDRVRVDVSGDDRCSAVVDHINEFIDREVDVRDLEAVRAHLLRCPPCLAQHDVQVALRDLVRRSCSERAPAELRVRILTTITRVRLTD